MVPIFHKMWLEILSEKNDVENINFVFNILISAKFEPVAQKLSPRSQILKII